MDPRQIVSLKNIIKIAAGYQCILAVDENGILWGWGTDNYYDGEDYGILGSEDTFNVGNPSGTYVTFEFGLPNGIWSYPGNVFCGTKGVYFVSTNSSTPTILYKYGYLKSTPSQDAEAINDLMLLIGTTHSYGLCSYQCHDFAQGCLMEYAEKYPNEFLPAGPVEIFSGFINIPTGPADEINVNTPTVFINLTGTVDSL